MELFFSFRVNNIIFVNIYCIFCGVSIKMGGMNGKIFKVIEIVIKVYFLVFFLYLKCISYNIIYSIKNFGCIILKVRINIFMFLYK